jgi:hypothetical protein
MQTPPTTTHEDPVPSCEPLVLFHPIPIPPGYAIRRWLGSGSEAVLYLARWAPAGLDVVLSLSRSRCPETVAGVLRVAASAAADQSHPLPILDRGVVNGLPYVTTPFLGAAAADKHHVSR